MHEIINKDKAKGQDNKNNQAFEQNTNPRNSCIQEYMILTSNPDAREDEPPTGAVLQLALPTQ